MPERPKTPDTGKPETNGPGIIAWIRPRIEEILMLLGALMWIVGEMLAVRKGEDTTTSYVRRGKKLPGWRGIVVTIMAVAGTVWLYLHFVHDKIG